MGTRRNLKRESEKAQMLRSQYELLLQAWSENAMLFHDMENHLQTIYQLAREGRPEDIMQYISRVSRPMEHLSGILWTGVGVVDAVLNAKEKLATEKGYRMDINAQLPANTGISEDDFCTVLTNLLDNAIESLDRERRSAGRKRDRAGSESGRTCQPETPPPVIQVSLRSIHRFLIVRVSNPCAGQPGPRLFPTSKRDGMRHGWGLKSVRRAVEKYNGSLSLEIAQGRFIATALLFFVPPG